MMQFIQSQRALEWLHLGYNYFSSEQTEEVLSFLCSCTELLKTTTLLELSASANFDTDRACELLA